MNRSLAIEKQNIEGAGPALILDTFLSSADATRAWRVLEKLSWHGLRHFHLTGRLAIETHRLSVRRRATSRALNDLDIVVPSFAAAPDTLARGFLARHIHPKAPEGKIVVQLLDAAEALRIDVFSACGSTLERSQMHDSPIGMISVVTLEDLAARTASLLMDLERGHNVARKHAEDFEWMAEFAHPNRVEIAWQDHRREGDPPGFGEARTRIMDLLLSRASLLVIPEYSQDVDAICPRCEETGAWRLASGQSVMSILGYV